MYGCENSAAEKRRLKWDMVGHYTMSVSNPGMSWYDQAKMSMDFDASWKGFALRDSSDFFVLAGARSAMVASTLLAETPAGCWALEMSAPFLVGRAVCIEGDSLGRSLASVVKRSTLARSTINKLKATLSFGKVADALARYGRMYSGSFVWSASCLPTPEWGLDPSMFVSLFTLGIKKIRLCKNTKMLVLRSYLLEFIPNSTTPSCKILRKCVLVISLTLIVASAYDV